MKKRLRKKLGRGEFAEYGFEIRWWFTPGLLDAAVDRFYDEFIGVIEGHNLYLWGWGDGETTVGFLNWAGRGSATEAHRQAVDEWLGERTEVVRHEVGQLQDARKWRREPNQSVV